MQEKDKIDQIKVARHWLKSLGITELLAQEGVTHVMINRPGEVVVEDLNCRRTYEKKELTYANCETLAASLAALNDEKIDSENPLGYFSLPDGQSAQIVIPPVTGQGIISICIRNY